MAVTNLDYYLTSKWIDSLGIEFLNTYYYRMNAGTPSAESLCRAFENLVSAAVGEIMSEEMNAVEITAYNLVNTTDFFTLTDFNEGQRTGEAMPSFVALNFTIQRSDRSFRNSAKRYGRLPESGVNGNAVAAGLETYVQGLLTVLNGDIGWMGTVFQLMMPKRVLTPNPNPPPALHYVLSDLSQPSGVGYPTVSTQNSRKT